jgi:hypothetical protein
MFQLVQNYGTVADSLGGVYQARAYGEPQLDGTWDGWLVFFPIGVGRAIASDRETTQPSFASLVHWASTIDPVYLQVALARALELQPDTAWSARLAELALLDRELAEDAAVLETAADRARADSEAAARDAAMHETAASVARAEAQERAQDALDLERDAALRDAALVDDTIAGAPAPTRQPKPRSQAADAPKRRRKK